MRDEGTPIGLRQAGDSSIADDATIAAGVLLARNLVIETGVTIEQGVVFAEEGGTPTLVRANVRLGAGSVIGAGVEIGLGAHVLAGSVVLGSVPPNAVVQGNPARIIGYTMREAGPTPPHVSAPALKDRRDAVVERLGIGEAARYYMPKISDMRGSLTVGEMGGIFPFQPQRYFIVFDVPSEELRGEHAHRRCHQFLLCVRGSCYALLDNGHDRREVRLDQPDIGLYMPPMIWGTQYRYSRDAVLLVLASHPYEADDYIRTYDQFLDEVRRRQS